MEEIKMYCKNCGSEVDKNDYICPNCGAALKKESQQSTNVYSILGIIFSILLALLGLIFSIIGLKKSDEIGSGKTLAIVGIVISVLNMIAGVLLQVLM